MIKVGLDGGNNSTILSTKEYRGDNAIIIPTVRINYRDYEGNFSFKKNEKDLISLLDVEVSSFNDKTQKRTDYGRHLVGQLALDTVGGTIDTRNMAQKKLGDNDLFVCMLTNLAYFSVIYQNKYEGFIESDFEIVVGLPYLQYIKEKDEYRDQFIGTHTVKFLGKFNIEVKVNILKCMVDCEGVGALISNMHKNGKFWKEPQEICDKFYMALDVGEYTTEEICVKFFYSEEIDEIDFDFYPPLCTGYKLGIANAKQPVIDSIRHEHEGTDLDRYKFDKIISHKIKPGILTTKKGEEIDIKPRYGSEIDNIVNRLGNDVVSSATNQGIQGQFVEIVLFGGGPLVLEKKFGSKLRDILYEGLACKNIVIAKNSSTANSDGYYERALVIFDN